MSQRSQQSRPGEGSASTTAANFASVPTAPYPPSTHNIRSPQRSALSSTPHYSTVYGGGTTMNLTASTRSSTRESLTSVSGRGDGASTANGDASSAFSSTIGGNQYYKTNSNVSSNSNNINNAGTINSHPTNLMFCPGWDSIVASINCISPKSNTLSTPARPLHRASSSGSNLYPSSVSVTTAPDTTGTGKQTPSQKTGPIMLELQRVELVEGLLQRNYDESNTNQNRRGLIKLPSSLRNVNDYFARADDNEKNDETEDDQSFFTTRTIGISRGDPSFGLSVASTCLSMPPVQTYDSLMAATGSSTGALCIHRFNSNDIGDESENTNSSVIGTTTRLFSGAPIEYFHTPRYQRQAAAVAWRDVNTNHVALGLVGMTGSGSTSHHHQSRRNNPNIRAGSDREYCCYIWDITANKKTTSPLQKLCQNSPVASLAWMMDGQTLVVGGRQRTIQLYDMRLSTDTNSPPLSAHAHESGVHGIEVDPNRPYQMATFCRAVGEPVKLFDIRRMDSVVSEIKVTNSYNQTSSSTTIGNSKASSLSNAAQRMQQAVVEAIQWSTLEPGMLTIATGDTIQDYDTSSGSRPALARFNHTKRGESIKAIALYRGRSEKAKNDVAMVNGDDDDDIDFSDSSRLLSLLYPRRVLAVLEDRTIHDMPRETNAPLAISRRDGRLIHALGSHLWVGSSSEGPSAMEKPTISIKDDDISAIMMKRARCLQTNSYSMNPEVNIKLLSREISGENLEDQSEELTTNNYTSRALLRLWSWIDRVESLSFQQVEDFDEDVTWMAKSLLDAGVWELLKMDLLQKEEDPDIVQDEVILSNTFGCKIYDSSSRRSALAACGWAGKFDLSIVMAECEALGEFERSAALAVWHENVGAAVEALQRGSQAYRLRVDGALKTSSMKGGHYAETLDLIAMCIAGFGGKTPSQMSVWRSACNSLLQREDMSATKAKESRIAYLRGLCEFLLSVGTSDGLVQILENVHLSLCDRVAFACRFLEDTKLKTYLLRCIEKCQRQGNVEGLVITGLAKNGIKILQSFVDQFSDVQTVALVASRVILPSEWAFERKCCVEWVECYRSLLNYWQMWQSRAMYDVDRAEVLRSVKARLGGTNYQRRIPNSRARQSPRPPDPDILLSIPAQLEVRCNYCSSPLSLKRNEGMTNQWLSKMQPLLNCCPQCRKPLPRCSICLLSLGGLNPYMELTRTRHGPRGTGKNLPSADDLSSLSSMSFAEWYTWCMRCRHGGHAHHMFGWFSGQEKKCPVSGCNCKCEFDSTKKLNRPAMCYEIGDSDQNT